MGCNFLEGNNEKKKQKMNIPPYIIGRLGKSSDHEPESQPEYLYSSNGQKLIPT